jgi:hypothetical protein
VRLTITAPTRWPDEQLLQRWWREEAAAFDREVADDHPDWLLVRGAAHRPGSRFELTQPEARGASAEVEVRGSEDDRTVHARFRVLADPDREATLDLDGLDVCRGGLTSTSRLAHLGWDVRAVPRAEDLLRATVRLDWLLAEVAVLVRRDVGRGHVGQEAPDPDRLEVVLDVRGRGVWRPLVSSVLRVLSGQVRRELDSEVARVAEVMAEVAAGLSREERQEAAARRSAAQAATRAQERLEADLAWLDLVEERLVAALRRAGAAPWGRRRRAWRAELAGLAERTRAELGTGTTADGLPSAAWLTGRITIEDVEREETTQLLLHELARGRGVLGRLPSADDVRRAVGLRRDQATRLAAPSEPVTWHEPPAGGPTGGAMPPGPVERIDLAWLASPRTALRHVLGSDRAADSALKDLAGTR